MSDQASPDGLTIINATLPASLGRYRLTTFKGDSAVKVWHAGTLIGTFPRPAKIAAFDLPFWVSSILKASDPKIDSRELEGYETVVSNELASQDEFTTICIGRKDQFHLATLLHIEWEKRRMDRRGEMLTVTGSQTGLRWTKEERLVTWTIIFRCEQPWMAEQLELVLRRPKQSLVSLDRGVTGIMAFNAERWETVGYAEDEVRSFAAQKNLILSQPDSDGAGLGFQVL